MLAHQPSNLDLSADLESWMPADESCPRCGGSGILRLGDHRYRTCLDCLGVGKLPVGAPPSPPRCSLSAAPSAAASR